MLPISLHAESNVLPKELKVAVILKNPNTLPYTSSRYLDYYKQGLNTASSLANTMGMAVKYKFYVMKDITKLPQQMQKIKNWDPGFIIGPNYSNAFLLLKNHFKNTLVLSAYANAQSIAFLPDNFHTLNPLNEQYAQTVYNYIVKTFPSGNVHVIVDKSCKACYGMSVAILNNIRSGCPRKKIYTNYFVDFISAQVPVEGLIKDFSKNDVILMLTTSDSAMVLIPKIADYLNYPAIFIGTDTWGSSVDSKLGRLRSKKPYTAIRVIPRSLQLDIPELSFFKQYYQKCYHKLPVDNITYAVFSTVNSVLYSLTNCKVNHSNEIRDQILTCYQQQLKKNRDAFRPKLFAIENVDASGNTLIGSISSSEVYPCPGTKHE